MTYFLQRMFLKAHFADLKRRAESLRRQEIMAHRAAAQEQSDAVHFRREREILVTEAQRVSAEITMIEAGAR